jgi:hypothetical protein
VAVNRVAINAVAVNRVAINAVAVGRDSAETICLDLLGFCHVAVHEQESQQTALARTVFPLLLMSILMFSAMAVEFSILLITVPQCLFLLVSSALLLREGALVPSLAMTGLIVCHILLALLLPFTLENSSFFDFAIYLDLAVMLMTSVTLMLFAAGWSVSALSERDETAVCFAQHTRRLELRYSQSQKHESLGY